MMDGKSRSARFVVPMLGVLIAIVGAVLIRDHMDDFVAWDFPLYYSAGRLPGPSLFDKATQEADQRLVYRDGMAGLRPYHFSIYLKPAAYKLVLDPLARLGFWDAYLLWVAVQLAGFAGALYLFSRGGGFPLEWWLLLPFNPFLFYMVYWGQDTGLVLLALALAWLLSKRPDGTGGTVHFSQPKEVPRYQYPPWTRHIPAPSFSVTPPIPRPKSARLP